MTSVELYETQLAFLDRVVERGGFGDTRARALRGVLLEHVKDRLAGATAYVGGTVRDDVLEASFPEYGPKRLEITPEPVTGKALPVHRGEVLRIEQLVGGTCVDFNAFNLHDHKEFLDCGFTRSFQSFDPGAGRTRPADDRCSPSSRSGRLASSTSSGTAATASCRSWAGE